MECNKDDAVRAKEIADRKFTERDYAGAKRFALKAQSLYPGLDGLTQMLTIFDVHLCAENKLSGEADWYGILGVNPWDNDELIRKQYRKLALMLHPDKNKSLGADGAFKLVSEAWSLLSDKSKRLAYNQRRNSRVSDQKTPSTSTYPSSAPHRNGTYYDNISSNVRTQHTSTRGNTTPVPAYKKADTFWTICSRCKTHYEYLRIYLNHNLLCPNCHQAFFAVEKAPPAHVFKSSNLPYDQMQQNSKYRAGGSNKSASGVSASTATQGPSRVHNQIASESERNYFFRGEEFSHKGENSLKKRKMDDHHSHVFGGSAANEMDRMYYSSGKNKMHSARELSYPETRHILMEKARVAIQNKLKEWKGMPEGEGKQDGTHVDMKNGGAFAPLSINVPDSDFHNFDLDRSESSFEVDQVWASYDDDDGMPRFYAKIQKVISRKPFKIQISWLNSKSSDEFGPLDWIGSGFIKTCGEFRVGRPETSRALNAFSHRVVWTKGLRGVISIVPRKGQIWALYRNWSSNWNEHTPDEIRHKYDVVEVLEDYNEEQGVFVAPLIKIAGFRTVFRRHMDPKEMKRVPREEMYSFSHQVPDHMLTGQEATNAPNGCWDLDPAAIPIELLQVIPEAETFTC
ncbi:J domain-containing protein [Psidium guajava]|nr:J domain-containing protein [Psidium guajava]